MAKKGSISFLKKRNKKLLFSRYTWPILRHVLKRAKVFWFFFSKKNCFSCACLPSPVSRSQGRLVLLPLKNPILPSRPTQRTIKPHQHVADKACASGPFR